MRKKEINYKILMLDKENLIKLKDMKKIKIEICLNLKDFLWIESII